MTHRALFLLVAVSPSLAGASTLWSGSLDYLDPTYNRPAGLFGLSFSATNVAYDVQQFQVSASGDYVFESGQDFDGFVLVYESAFDPANPLSGLIGGGDEFTPDPFSPNDADRNQLLDPWTYGFGSKLDSVTNGFGTFALAQGTRYFAVTTAFDNLGQGNYENALGGPGEVVLGAVPEPTSLLGLVCGGFLLIKRRTGNTRKVGR